MSDDRDISTVKTPAAELKILEDVSPDGEGDDVEENVGRFVWPTAVPLLRHIIDSDSSSSSSSSSLDIQNCRLIVELGAGCGVLGMGLAAAAAAVERTASVVGTGKNLEANRDDGSPSKEDLHIILTDHDEDWLRRNVALNEPLLRETTSATLEATRLDWRDPNDIAAVQVAVLERLTNVSDGNGDGDGELLVVASDVLYNHGAHGDLARTLYELSKSQRTRIVMGFPDRDWDEEHFRPFATELFGEEFPRSEPIDPRHHKRGRMTDLRVIDFCVDSKKLSPGI